MSGMLHDCGVSSTDVHHHLVTELDWDNAQIHCLRGEMLLKNVPLYRSYAPAILYHHTHWDAFPKSVDNDTRNNANMLYLADRIDALRVQLGDATLEEKNAIRETITKYAGSMFSKPLVEAFLDLSTSDSFWFYMESEALDGYFMEWIEQGENDNYPFYVLKDIAQMFADVVDAKSNFTSEHTYGVAAVARYIAQLKNLPLETQEKIELSAFFHDLGKLRVADAILHKNGVLTADERTQMNRHGFDSNVILRKINGFQDIAKIASMHHETLDGKGYPYHLSGEQIPLEVRILTVADIFQALVQNRPYRIGLSALESYKIMSEMCDQDKIDRSLLDLLHIHLDECYAYALNPKLHLSEVLSNPTA
jgi:HD-GYP domain-containing protein (c-di-GMP phosphodiesterase class II)